MRAGAAAIAIVACVAYGSAAAQQKPKAAPKHDVDRSASMRFSYVGAPADYDPPFAKNQYVVSAYGFPVYDSLVRVDAPGNIVPDLAESWSFSADKLTLTMQLRKGVKFTDGSDLTADVVVKSLMRSKKDPGSLVASQLATLDSAEARDPHTVVLKLNLPDENILYALGTSAGFIVSAKALDGGATLALNPIGTGPYKLISSGPQGASYERNEDYFDKSQNQLAKVAIVPIQDVTARLNALQSGQIDAGLYQVDQWPQIQAMVKSGRFTVHRVLGPNSLPMWFNTKIKPFDDSRVRMALNLAIDRNAINQGIMNGQCLPASQPLQPGVVGHDDSLKAYTRDVAKAKALLKEAGVGPFSFDALSSVQEPLASIAVAIKQQLQDIGVTMNLIPTNNNAIRPQFRAGTSAAMVQTLSVPAPDPASIIDAVYMSADNPGGVSPEFANAVKDARTKAIGSKEREAAFKKISRMAYDDPRQMFVCWAPTLVVARKGVVGMEEEAYLNAVPIPDIRTYGILKAK
jgi:peptide/nickel transport system substrate-binding protein